MPGAFWYPPILTYHRVHPDSASDTPTMTPAVFERQMTLLAERWRPISLRDLVRRLATSAPVPPRAVAITFDDGTEDTAKHAWPVLARLKVPATIFMIADNVDRPGHLTRGQLRQLQADGVTIGSHTVHHAYLPSLSPDRAQRELRDSKQQLEEILQRPVDLLSYPGGGFTAVIAAAAEEAGYQAACTTNRGYHRFPIDCWALRRITMHGTTTTSWAVGLRCCGYYHALKRLRPPS